MNADDWWESMLPEGCDFVGEVTHYWDHIRHDVEPEDLADEQRRLSILNPDGTRQPCPATHEAWSVFIDLLHIAWPHDDGCDDLPRPVVVIDLG